MQSIPRTMKKNEFMHRVSQLKGLTQHQSSPLHMPNAQYVYIYIYIYCCGSASPERRKHKNRKESSVTVDSIINLL